MGTMGDEREECDRRMGIMREMEEGKGERERGLISRGTGRE